MAPERIDPGNQIPEADLLEQQAQVAAPPLSAAEDTHVAADAPANPSMRRTGPEQQAPLPAAEDEYPHQRDQARVVVMADPLVEAALRVYADFAEHATLTEVLAVVTRCRTDLDTPTAAALPELVERLARQRLADHLAPRVTGNGAHPADH